MQKQTRHPQTSTTSQQPANQPVEHPDEKDNERLNMQNAEQTGTNATEDSSATGDLVITNSQELMKGQSQIAITHQGDTYFLRVTKQGKLLLTK